MGIPAWAINESRPRVLSETVLPPVLGPLMMSCFVPGGRMIVRGTGAFGSSPASRAVARMRISRRGWRAATKESCGGLGEIGGSLHSATDGEAVGCSGRDDVSSGG